MSLQKKAVLYFNCAVIAACVLIGFLGYRSATGAFAVPLQMKALSNVKSVDEIMNEKFAGDWQIINGRLFKGEVAMNDNSEIVDFLGEICDGHVTIFQNDTRVATTVKNEGGQRLTGTKASEKIIAEVLTAGKIFSGSAEVVGATYQCAYLPIKDNGGLARRSSRPHSKRFYFFDGCGDFCNSSCVGLNFLADYRQNFCAVDECGEGYGGNFSGKFAR